MSIKMSLEVEYDDHKYELRVSYTPAYAGCHYLKNGDPGNPPEPSEMEILLAVEDGREMDSDEVEALADDSLFIDTAEEAALDELQEQSRN